MNRRERITFFVEEISQWYQNHKRELPWRDLEIEDDTQRAYQVLVSEIMLQQTQVSRVIIIYKRFLESFPTLADLAAAGNAEVIVAWRGMGYNSRALRLRDAARSIQEEHNGVFPKEMEELLAVKGIGHYTAAAVRNFAFNLATPCLDTNIRRILHRVFYGPERADGTWPKNDKELLILAEEVLEEAVKFGMSGADWHAALMDFGSLVCTKRSPKWEICPLTLRGICKAAYRVPDHKPKKKTEPGRTVGSTFIPNRIFRGKIIEELRDATTGLSSNELGQRVCIDWSEQEHKAWLQGILKKLEKDQLIVKQKQGYVLTE